MLTSAPFCALSNLASLARKQVETDADYLENFFVRKYGRPTFSGNFEDRSEAAWQLEMLRDLWRRRALLLDQMKQQHLTKNNSPEAKAYMDANRVQLDAISHLFGLVPDRDEVVEDWTQRVERGEDVDMEAHLASLKVSDKMRAHLDRLSGTKARNQDG